MANKELFSAYALDALEGIREAKDFVATGKDAAGRSTPSAAGRRWAILATELEKVEALIEFYWKDDGLAPDDEP